MPPANPLPSDVPSGQLGDFGRKVSEGAHVVYDDITKRVQRQDAQVLSRAFQYMNLGYATLLLASTIVGFMFSSVPVSLTFL